MQGSRLFSSSSAKAVLLVLVLALVGLLSFMAGRQSGLEQAVADAMRQSPAPPPASRPAQPSPDERLQKILAEAHQLADGQGPDQTVTVTYKVREAIRNGDFATADSLLDKALKDSYAADWRWTFYPLGNVIINAMQPADEAFQANLDRWVKTSGAKSPLPWLARGSYRLSQAWYLRGEYYVSKIVPAHLKAFMEQRRLALEDLNTALKRDDTLPLTWFKLFAAVRLSSDSQQKADAVFNEASQRFPEYFPLHDERLYDLTPKWGGSVKAMVDFTQARLAKAPADSPMLMLSFSLYNSLLQLARDRCREVADNQLSACMESTMAELAPQDLNKWMRQALEIYPHANPAAYSGGVKARLENVTLMPGMGKVANDFVQTLAEVTGTDTTLSSTDLDHNNYAVDWLVGNLWVSQQHYVNAETFYQRALADVQRADYLDTSERARRVAEIYQRLSWLYNQTNQPDKALAHAIAAGWVAGMPVPGALDANICHDFNQAGMLQAAVESCTAVIQANGSLYAYYWRGKTYEALKDYDLAIADFTRVADSESGYRAGGVINASYLMGLQHKIKEQLDFMNAYPWAFDAAMTSKDDLAITFNNRCYAKMELGMLESALADCETSLKYGNIPDALAKEKRLRKMLKK